jgi:hypothetical protein
MTPLIFAFFWPFTPDPAPSFTRTKAESRQLECVPVSLEEARRTRPGRFREPKARVAYRERSLVECSSPLLDRDLRHPRDQGVLATLDPVIRRLVSATVAARADLRDRTWLVEVYYPSQQVAAKISFAAKVALRDQGWAVSDLTPVLSPTDVDVLQRMPFERVYADACTRYPTSRDGSKALLGVALADVRATELHAGVCADGAWTWVQ